ncbi:MAG: hypothetical protein M3451_11750 [Chloroflexota bacterium]|nr:hypothetical protein [Chloroflexota bacterium]
MTLTKPPDRMAILPAEPSQILPVIRQTSNLGGRRSLISSTNAILGH